jgi:preprotein translocase subunit SecE
VGSSPPTPAIFSINARFGNVRCGSDCWPNPLAICHFPDYGSGLSKIGTYIAPGCPSRSDGAYPEKEFKEFDMAKMNPAKFFNEVKTEFNKVVWPTRAETVQTAIMVLIMTTILAFFFLGVDAAFAAIVKGLLSLAK